MLFFMTAFNFLAAQNSLKVRVIDKKTRENLVGVNVAIKGTAIGAATNNEGETEIKNIPDGIFVIKFSYVGYEEKNLEVTFPTEKKDLIIIELEPTEIEMEGITISTTRTNSRIEDVPVRVEVLGLEEIEERAVMRPSNIAELLTEASGIQVQQTSATSGNVNIKIQGLDGKYTQILKDGFPLYGNFKRKKISKPALTLFIQAGNTCATAC